MLYTTFSADDYSTKKECRDAAKAALRQAREHGLTQIRLTVRLDVMIEEILRIQAVLSEFEPEAIDVPFTAHYSPISQRYCIKTLEGETVLSELNRLKAKEIIETAEYLKSNGYDPQLATTLQSIQLAETLYPPRVTYDDLRLLADLGILV